MIYYDERLGEWAKDIDTTFLAPELYFVILQSPDDKQYHEFYTDKGVIKFCASNDEFEEKFNELKKTYKIYNRKSWIIPKEQYEAGIEYFGLK